MRGGGAAADPPRDLAHFYQIVGEQGQDVIRIDPAPVGIHDAEAVCVAVRRQADRAALFLDALAQFGQIVFARVRARAGKKHVAMAVNGDEVRSGFAEQFVEIPSPRAKKRVVGDL